MPGVTDGAVDCIRISGHEKSEMSKMMNKFCTIRGLAQENVNLIPDGSEISRTDTT